MSFKKSDLSEEVIIEVAKKNYKSSVEDWLNAYEEACMKYLDKKLDKIRFRKSFRSEIRNIVEEKNKNNPMYSLIHPEGTSKYEAIWKVYHEWEDLE